MFKRHISYLFISAALASGPGVDAAEFKGPLDVPARISPVLAQRSRLVAASSAGDSLVVVGPRGHILLSQDGGKNWAQSPVPVSSDLVAVRFLNKVEAWAVGHDGVVLHTANGGKSWDRQLDGKQAAALVGEYLKRRLDAGDEEARAREADLARFAEEGADKPFLDVLFLNEKQGFVVGAFGSLFQTRDGGKTWEPLLLSQDNPGALHLYALASHGGSVFVAGERGLLMRWNAQTQRFVALPTPYKGSYFGLLSTPQGLVAFGLRGNVYVSGDDGQSWTKLDTPGADSVVGASLLGDGRAVYVTRGGKIWVSQPGLGPLLAVSSQKLMTYTGVAAFGKQSIVATGSRGLGVEVIGNLPTLEK